MNPIHIISLILIVLTASLPVMCLVKMRVNRRFRQQAITTTAEILQVEKKPGSRSTYYIVQLQYVDVAGDTYTGQTVFSRKKEVGDRIPLWYKATDPSIFKTDSGKWLRWVLLVSVLFLASITWLVIWLQGLEYSYPPG